MTLLRWLAGARGAVRPGVLVAGGVAASTVAVVIATVAGGGGPPPTGSANLWIDTTGGTCTRQVTAGAYSDAGACATMRAACAAATSGDTVRVRPGSYGGQWFAGSRDPTTGNNTAACVKTITFIGDPTTPTNVVIQQLATSGSNQTFDGFDFNYGGATSNGQAVVETGGDITNWTLKNSRVGNIVDNKGMGTGGTNNTTADLGMLIQNVVFHDVYASVDTVHNECIQTQSPGADFISNTFYNCASADISLSIGDFFGQQPYCGTTMENNIFSHAVTNSGPNWAGFSVWWFKNAFCNERIVGNTFESPMLMEVPAHTGAGPYTGVWANNIGSGWACLSGVTFAGNIGTACNGSDTTRSPASSSQSVPANYGWLNPATFDFHLGAGSAAIGVGSAAYAATTDREGHVRCGVPDAGALEYTGDC